MVPRFRIILSSSTLWRYTFYVGGASRWEATRGKRKLRIGFQKTATEAARVIYVNQDQLDQVKYLLRQSAQGNHLLFDEKVLRRIAPRIGQPEARDELVKKAEHLLEQMILRPSISSKRAFLEELDPETYDEVARVYFNIVQNTVAENQGFSH
jgi:hypothetical protein